MEPRALNRPVIGALVLGAMAVILLVWRLAGIETGPGPLAEGPPVLAEGGERVKVEVINTTLTPGLARRATLLLREAGFDVVRYLGDTSQKGPTRVFARSGDRRRAERVARALGTTRIESRPDSTYFLDVTVLVGSDWHPPSKAFHP